MERIQFVVQMHDPVEQARLCRLLQAWKALYCASVELVEGAPDEDVGPSVLFWDLDGGLPPPRFYPGKEQVLFVCSSDAQAAIRSYLFHPNGFLQKPVSMEQLEKAGAEDRKELPYHRMILEKKLPYTIGGGIGQSRLCMLLLGRAHVGEVQASVWPEEMRSICEAHGMILL